MLRARVRDRIRARATELGLEGGNNFRGVQIKRDSSPVLFLALLAVLVQVLACYHS